MINFQAPRWSSWCSVGVPVPTFPIHPKTLCFPMPDVTLLCIPDTPEALLSLLSPLTAHNTAHWNIYMEHNLQLRVFLILDTWVAQSVKRPTLDFGSGHDLTVREIESRIRFCADSACLLGILSLPLSLPSPLLALSRSLKIKINFKKKFFLKLRYLEWILVNWPR